MSVSNGETSWSKDRASSLRWLGWRCIITVVTCAAIAGILEGYIRRGVVGNSQEDIFNALIQGTQLILGLNLTTALKEMAGIMENKVLKKRSWVKDNYPNFNIASYQDIISVIFGASGHRMDRFWAILWVLLGIAANIGIALIGLTYGQESSNAINTTPDRNVNITSFERFRMLDRHFLAADILQQSTFSDDIPLEDETEGNRWAIANMYGSMSITLGTVDPDTSFETFNYAVEQRPSEIPNWTYYLREYSTSTNSLPLRHRTNRYVEVEPECEYFPTIQGQSGGRPDGTFWIQSGSSRMNVTDFVPQNRDLNSTNWAYDVLQNNLFSCGPRCARIYASLFQVGTNSTNQDISVSFYNCTITISEMRNANPANPLHRLPDSVAHVLAGSIALNVDGDGPHSRVNSRTYGTGIVWGGLNRDDPEDTANLVGRYAVGAVAMMDIVNVRGLGAGDVPWIGVRLIVNWIYLGINLGVISFVHFVLAMVTYMWSRS